MIPVKDLILWAEEHAIGRSPSQPHGWVSAQDLRMLSVEVEKRDPLAYWYSFQNNLPEEDM